MLLETALRKLEVGTEPRAIDTRRA